MSVALPLPIILIAALAIASLWVASIYWIEKKNHYTGKKELKYYEKIKGEMEEKMTFLEKKQEELKERKKKIEAMEKDGEEIIRVAEEAKEKTKEELEALKKEYSEYKEEVSKALRKLAKKVKQEKPLHSIIARVLKDIAKGNFSLKGKGYNLSINSKPKKK